MASCGSAKLVVGVCGYSSSSDSLILARVGKKQCSYFVVAWPNVQTTSLLYTQNIYSGPFKTRGMSVSKATSFPLFRA